MKLTNGTVNVRELINGYLDDDPTLKPSQLQNRLRLEHDLDVPTGTCSSSRHKYLNGHKYHKKPSGKKSGGGYRPSNVKQSDLERIGVRTVKELVERYLIQDGSLTPTEITQRIRKDHGLNVPKNSVRNTKTKYNQNNGRLPITKYRPKTLAPDTYTAPINAKPVVRSVSIDALKQFSEAVSAVGGAGMAGSILSIIGGEQ